MSVQRTIQELFEVSSPVDDAGFPVKAEEFVVLSQEPSAAEAIAPKIARPFIEVRRGAGLRPRPQSRLGVRQEPRCAGPLPGSFGVRAPSLLISWHRGTPGRRVCHAASVFRSLDPGKPSVRVAKPSQVCGEKPASRPPLSRRLRPPRVVSLTETPLSFLCQEERGPPCSLNTRCCSTRGQWGERGLSRGDRPTPAEPVAGSWGEDMRLQGARGRARRGGLRAADLSRCSSEVQRVGTWVLLRAPQSRVAP